MGAPYRKGKPNSVGRPTKLNDERRDIIVKALAAGNYLEPSCYLAGIAPKTAYEWIKRGRAEDERLAKNPRARMRKSEVPFVDFREAVCEAQARAETEDVERVADAGKIDWKAAAWRLERKHPDRWGRRIRQDISADGQIAHTITVAADPGGPAPRDVSDEELAEADGAGLHQVNAFVVPPEPNVTS